VSESFFAESKDLADGVFSGASAKKGRIEILFKPDLHRGTLLVAKKHGGCSE